MRATVPAVLSTFLVAANAGCGCGGHDHGSTPTVAVTPPSRTLEWGDINFLHTTDTHGWLLGHQKTSFPEPNYSGTLGDFASFVTHMKEIAKQKDADLLLIDSGDLHDGTGLSDGFPAGDVDGHETNKFLTQLPYDVMAIGKYGNLPLDPDVLLNQTPSSHELYEYEIALDMHKNFAPTLKGRYLSSNVNITLADENNNTVNVPVGERFAKFETNKGRRVTALGVLYEFTGNDKNITVQKIADMVEETWFKDAIQEEPDFFLLVGHMPVSRDNWPVVFDAIRAVHKTAPIIVFGGHTHIRDCVQLDGRSMSLESGRYMETVGWMSAKLDSNQDGSQNITFSRRYLDPNRVTYKFHTKDLKAKFDTDLGRTITKGLKELYNKFTLNFTFGIAPHDFTLFSAPYPSENSSLSLFAEKATPFALSVNNSRADIPNFIITNSGSQRFDIYSGPFTRDDQFTASPFADAFLYIQNVTLSSANEVLAQLNNAGADKRDLTREEELFARGYVQKRYLEWLEDMDRRSVGANEKRAAENLTVGYVTQDSCPGVGDDVLHAPLKFFSAPDFIASNPPNVTDDTPIDLVFVDFIEDQLLGILNTVQNVSTYTSADVQKYSPLLASDVLGVYAQNAWN